MSDLAGRALDTVASTLQIDPEWLVRSDRELTWTGWRLPQTFSVDGPFESRGMPVHRISAVVPAVVPRAKEKLLATLSALNHMTVGDALVWDSREGIVKSHVAAVFHEETFDWRLSQFISFSIIQLALLEARFDLLGQLLKGDLVLWEHPTNGARSDPDDMLNVVERLYQPIGQEPSRFVGAEFDEVERWVHGTPFFTAGADPTGIAIEVPFGSNDTSLVRLLAAEEHPTLGNGLLVTVQVRPPESNQIPLSSLASGLNWLEYEEERSLQHFGAWHEVIGMLAHSTFLPNASHIPGLIQDAAMGGVNRALWAADTLRPPGQDDGPHDAVWISHARFLRMLGGGEWAEA